MHTEHDTSPPAPLGHVPVMTREVVTMLAPSRGGLFVDCTVGAGGHSRALLEAGAGRVLGLDRDPDVLPLAARTLAPWKPQVELVHSDYREFEKLLDARGITEIDGALADIGVSSMQLDSAGRGFSFRRDDPLDMRMDRSTGPTAAELLRDVDETTLADRIFQYGEERYSRRIARAIVHVRQRAPIDTTAQLAAIVRQAVPPRGRQKIDQATRTFQALRIWVNRELDGLETFLHAVIRRLRVGARLAVIAFHSLEDRIVKLAFRALGRGDEAVIRILTKRPLRPESDETARNPRARSARLRAAERMA
jgi:16S rRNA (cytosine1402-N4)-methyltransferase